MKITFRQIDAFQTLINSGTVTKAATLLGISQPAVSRLISGLEKSLGFTLFRRCGRKLEPTLEARLLAEEVAKSEGNTDALYVTSQRTAKAKAT